MPRLRRINLIKAKKGVSYVRRSKAIAYARRLLKRMNTTDPFELADALNIHVMMRNDFKSQKGAFKVILGQMFIFINSNLSEELQRIICAHEIGHALMHKHLAVNNAVLMEFELFNITSEYEYDANVFAACILLDEDEIIELAQQGYDVVQISRQLGTNVNLLLVKINEMNNEGMNYRMPYQPDCCFLCAINDDAGEL